MNDVTIEKLDQILERVPNATYSQAKEALITSNGNVIDAIILLENKNFTCKAKKKVEDILPVDCDDLKEITNKVNELLKKSSVIRIIIEKNGKIILNLPLTVGVVGLALGPLYALIGLSAAVITKYRIKIQNEDDGAIVDLGELNEEKINMLKQMLTNTAKEVKDVVTKDDKDITDDLMNEIDKENK